jgi:hypothetical protein
MVRLADRHFRGRDRVSFRRGLRLYLRGLVRERLPPRGAASAEFPHARSWTMVARLAAVPLLIFSAPYLIMRNTLRGGPLERRRGEVVMVATVIAGLWSLMSGTVVVMALQALPSV